MIGLLKTLAIISIFSINFGHATTDISNDNTKDTDITTNTGLNSAVENIMTDILDTTLESQIMFHIYLTKLEMTLE